MVICDFMRATGEANGGGSSRAAGERPVRANCGDSADNREDEAPQRQADVGAAGEQVADPSADERAGCSGAQGEERTGAVVAGDQRNGDGARHESDYEPNQNAHVTCTGVKGEAIGSFRGEISTRM